GEQGEAVVGVGLVVGRNVVARVVGEQREPVVELPRVEQIGLAIEQILHLGAGNGAGDGRVHAAASISSLQRRQKPRRWPSWVSGCWWLGAMAGERSFQ